MRTPAAWYRNWILRSDPRRQPVERSCCMSTPMRHETRRMLAAIIAISGDRRPNADISNTETTNALEIGFESEIPHEIPLMNTNRNTRASANSTQTTG
jgi:hypothetical protein